MASMIVDGLVIPISVAGQPAIDFCNTRAGWGCPAPKEYLVSHAHLCVWAGENGLITPAAVRRLRRAATAAPADASAVVARAVRLRDALHAVLVGPARSSHWAAVNLEVRRAGAAAVLRPLPGSTPSFAGWEIPAATGLELPLLSIARASSDLLTTSTRGTISACPGAGCGWLFADPRGRRRWCSMAICGNRAKVRRHAQRLRNRA